MSSPSQAARQTAPRTIDQRKVDHFVSVLKRRVAGDVRTDTYTKMLYSTDASLYQVMPLGVLIPRSIEDVQAAVEIAAQLEMPILPRTSGSSLAGQTVNEALIIDFSRHLDQMLEVNREEHWVRVQPGIVLDQLNLSLSPYGLQYGPDPASSNRAAIGGIVSNNSTGSHSIVYGMTADHVLETAGFLADGSPFHFSPVESDALAQRLERDGLEGDIYRGISRIASENADTILAGTPRHWRRCGGYNLDRFLDGASYNYPRDTRFNLAKLLCGAEGTLGVMSEIKLNLVPRPTSTTLAIVHFDSLYEALSSVPALLETGPSAVELLDNLGLTMCRDVPQYARLLSTFLEGEPDCILITEYYGESEAELASKLDGLRSHVRRRKIPCRIVPATTPAVQANVWTVRKVGLGLMMSIKGDHKPVAFIEDAAVPVEHLAEYVTRIERFCNDIGTRVAYYAHASAGCVHIRPLMNTKDATDVAKLPQISSFAAELLGQYGGSLSSEHGAGRARSWLNEQFYGKELFGLYREVKGLFDPKNILNPGNMVEPGPMTERLRYGADYRASEAREHIDFGDYGGFNRAVEMCNGAAVCKKRTEGTMCPSYMVTREEMHSTRGRANSLRAALSGRLPGRELTSKRMFEVMDLCVECKACKAECPSSVDMTRIKFEFLARYYERHRIPLRARLFADIARISRLSSGGIAPLANALLRAAPVKWLAEKLLGISRHRTLPTFASVPFTRWYAAHTEAAGNRAAGEESKEAARDSGEPGGGPDSTRGAAERDEGGTTTFPGRSRSTAGPENREQLVLFNDTFNTYNTPETAIAATELFEAAGFEVVLPGHRCCGRPAISKGLVEKARSAAEDTIARLAPFAERGVPIVGLEPSCTLTLRDEYFALLPNDPRVKMVADDTYTFEEFILILADQGRLDGLFERSPERALIHGHCHQKSLVGTEASRRALALAGLEVEVVDSGCCGMAGAFGYEAEHYEISRAMSERRLVPAVQKEPEGSKIVAAGTSCKQQIGHFAGRTALHPAEVLRAALTSRPKGDAGR